jgi:hypothetical protein
MPAVPENPSPLLGTAPRPEPEASGVNIAEQRLRELEQPKKLPPVQSLRELWQVMKEVMRETRRARALERDELAAAQRTRSSTPQP